MSREAEGYHRAVAEALAPGDLYLYRFPDGRERPDPASRRQPLGVHGPSALADPRFPWSDGAWRGSSLERSVIYELHVGTFSPEGTFDGVVAHLPALAKLGVNAIEPMPVGQFPGSHNWGYDGVFLFAAQESYGGLDGLRRLVAASHRLGISVFLDVVYNHVGPEGNYLADFGPYFHSGGRTPWGDAVLLDGPGSDEVRRFFVENALFWLREAHADGLRLDAVHALIDRSARPFLEELSEEIAAESKRQGRPLWLIAESTANDPRLVRPRSQGGLGLDALWNDDFHHALHAALTQERGGYYADFGSVADLAKAFTKGFVLDGRPSLYRGRRHGRPADDVPSHRLVVYSQNHDQVGNRARSERLIETVGAEGAKLAAAVVLLSPYVPLLFMGEEHGETAPFPYFVSHGDPDLVEAVRRGRLAEFRAFGWREDPPDPQAEETFLSARLDWSRAASSAGRAMRAFYAELLRLRREHPALSVPDRRGLATAVFEQERLLVVTRSRDRAAVMLWLHLGSSEAEIRVSVPPGSWRRVLDSSEQRFCGPGASSPARLSGGQSAAVRMAPCSAAVFALEKD